MAGNAKFDFSSANPEDSCFAGSFLNGQRGIHSGANLDRLGSFHDSRNVRGFSPGISTFKGNAGDMSPLSQCLMLEPIPIGDQKSTRSVEFRKALGLSFGCISEDNFFGVAHSRPAPTLAVDTVDGLKHFRASIQDCMDKARIRVKRVDESMNKLATNLSSRKQQIHQRSSGSNLLKMGTQSYKNSPDPMTQKVDDRGKNLLSKRARTPVADTRVEGRVSGILRQHMILGKDKDMVKEGISSPDSVEEKMRRLPAGESWDKKMKRKRTVTNVFPRPVDGDVELKRATHGRLSNDSGLPSSDCHGFRSGSFNVVGGNTKQDSALFDSSSNVRSASKNETNKATLPRELPGMNKERISQKKNNRQLVSPSLVTRGKASRVPRVGIAPAGSSSPNFSHMSGAEEDWEQPLNVNKIQSVGGINSRKRALPSESSSPPMAQWVGQRPHRIPRNRRANIISPASNDDEALASSEGCAASDYITKTSGGMNALFPARTMANDARQLKVKNEYNTSLAGLSESKENGAVENQLKEKAICSVEAEERGVNGIQHVGFPGLLSKKKMLVKEEVGDGVRKQGRSGRGSVFPRGRMSLSGDKLDSSAAAKPVRAMKPTSEKNGSKSGRPPLKKHLERKGFTRLALLPNENSPDCTVESEDDREDLFAAAQLACNTSYNACSSSFWKKMEPLFSIRAKDRSYLLQQKDIVAEELNHQPQLFVSQGEKYDASHGLQSTKAEDLVNLVHDGGLLNRRDLEEGTKNITSLYKRVLSALIVEDELEELERSNCGNPSFGTSSIDGGIFFNGDITRGEIGGGDYSFMHSEAGVIPAAFQSSLNGSFTPEINVSSNYSSEGHYALLSMDERLTSELRSIGLYLDTEPDLAGGENEVVSENEVQLEKLLHQLADKKKSCLERAQKAVEEEMELEERALEQNAVNRLSELAYKKLLATRGSSAAKLKIKVPKPVALAFVKRTLARSRKFEETGKSCFSEPALRDIMLAGQPSCNDLENVNATHLIDYSSQSGVKLRGLLDFDNGKAERVLVDSCNRAFPQSDHAFAKNGPIINRGKKDVLLDNVGNGALRSSAQGNPVGKDLSARNSVGKSGHPLINNSHGNQKAKSKPNSRAAQMPSTHPVGPSARSTGRSVVNSGSNRKGEDVNIHDSSQDWKKDPVDLTNLPLHELDSVELGVDNDLGGDQDLGSWLNFDEDSLLDNDCMGLEIPMDDLSELNMLL